MSTESFCLFLIPLVSDLGERISLFLYLFVRLSVCWLFVWLECQTTGGDAKSLTCPSEPPLPKFPPLPLGINLSLAGGLGRVRDLLVSGPLFDEWTSAWAIYRVQLP